ncbi:MAG TPA: FAD-dependent oxidoreductase, partial [Caulobacteraceae bacterium]|nr:FAD-dependent oxidoreductase [Caulobacteraceae bacterium]
FTALALAPSGREITLFERDPPPPPGGAEEAFDAWARRGVGHLRHSHAFLARLRTLIGAEHPDLLEALREAGAREPRFADGLPASLRDGYLAVPEDEELAVIVSRRTTLELVIRRHVEAQPNVTLHSGAFVRGLVTEPGADGAVRARGLRVDGEGEIAGDLVIDAGGRSSPVADWLAETGIDVPEEEESCAILYYTRFYRRVAGAPEPPRGRFATTGDLGYLKFAVFPADNGTFSITLAAPEVEETLRTAIPRPECFEAICARLPGVAPWTDPATAAPVSRVHGMGELNSRWREMAPGGAPLIGDFFRVGDSLVQTNPLYGRGCSFAAIQAHLLRDVLNETADTAARARLYAERVRGSLRPYHDDMAQQDRGAARRALHGLDPAWKPSWRGRLTRSFLEDGVAIAVRRDIGLMRAALRGFHMLAPPRAWLTRPAAMATILATWARGREANARFYAEKPGPPRAEMFAALGLSVTEDLMRAPVS